MKDLPYILGEVFSTLSKAIAITRTLKTKKLPRMADSYLEMLSIAIALGIDEEEYIRIYNENIEKLNKTRTNTDLFFAVKDYMDSFVDGRKLEGTMREVYNKIYSATSNKNLLPKSASHFSRQLRSELDSFASGGLQVNIDDTRPDATHIQIIKK